MKVCQNQHVRFVDEDSYLSEFSDSIEEDWEGNTLLRQKRKHFFA